MTQQWPPAPQHQVPPQPNHPGFPSPPPIPEPKAERRAPVDVGTAAQLLWIVAGFGVIQALAGFAVLLGERSAFVDELMKNPSIASGEVAIGRDEVELLFYLGLGFTGALVVGFTAVFFLVVRLMRRGRSWARTLLTVVSVMMVVWTVPVLFGIGSDGSVSALALGGVQILQAVVAVGAVVLMHRKDSDNYFLRLPSPDK